MIKYKSRGDDNWKLKSTGFQNKIKKVVDKNKKICYNNNVKNNKKRKGRY